MEMWEQLQAWMVSGAEHPIPSVGLLLGAALSTQGPRPLAPPVQQLEAGAEQALPSAFAR